MIKLVALFMFSITINSQLSCPNDARCGDCYNGRCLACYGSYPDVDGVCIEPVVKIDRCLQYRSEFTCEKCQHGYKVQNNQCVRITQANCAMVDALDKCVMCNKGIMINNQGTCESYNMCRQSSCDYCAFNSSGQQFCRRCANNYVLQRQSDGLLSCVLEDGTRKQRNCLLLNSVTNGCEICDFNYYETRDGCVKSYLKDLVLDPQVVQTNTNNSSQTVMTTSSMNLGSNQDDKTHVYIFKDSAQDVVVYN